MRIHQRHQRQEAIVGDAQKSNLAVAFRNILHQPVDGVVSVRGVIDGGRVLRPVQRPVHDVVALRAVLAAHVLDHADVTAFDDHIGRIVVALQDRTQVRTLRVAGQPVGVVRRAGQQDGSAMGALGQQDHGVQLHAVPHRDHRLALAVIEAIGGLGKLRRNLARKGRVLSCLSRQDPRPTDAAQSPTRIFHVQASITWRADFKSARDFSPAAVPA